jgi:hypothetical protein
MDYVHGRACKFHVIPRDGQLFIPARWYGHSERDLQDLLAAVGKRDAEAVETMPERIAA